VTTVSPKKLSVVQTFLIFLRLGLTSFGGPVAHLGYFREEFVNRRHCLSDGSYADLVALCQFLPGPASSQVGIGIGLSQAGIRGALAAWLGFTLPSAGALVLIAYGLAAFQGSVADFGWVHGLKIAAAAVVAHAIIGMAKSLCPDQKRGSVAIVAAFLMLTWSNPLAQLLVILLSGFFGILFLKTDAPSDLMSLDIPVGRSVALASLALFVMLFLGIPVVAGLIPNHGLAMFDSFFRTGSLVFGGGHVVLPLLQAEVVSRGWISKDLFLAGYGAAQAVPGPLFTFSAYLGAAMHPAPAGWIGGVICLSAIFLPSFLLVIGILPYWDALRRIAAVRTALMGINAAVVGLLLAAFYNPVLTSSIQSPKDCAVGLVAFGLLAVWKVPPWCVVLITALGGAILAGF
jgi:chromate transporter